MSGKSILFIGLGFYDYDKAICDMLENLGYDVDYTTSLSRPDVRYKLFKKLHLNSINKRRDDNFAWHNITSSRKANDIVFVIKGENLSKRHLDYLRQANPDARFILYLWDNLNKIHNREILLPYFDKVASFDRIDCVNHSEFHFRPLFSQKKDIHKTDFDYTISFIGEDRPGRYKFLKTIRRLIPDDMPVYLRLKSSLLRTVTDKIAGHGLCTNRRLPYDEFCRITYSSEAVLDIVEQNQSGLTMRTIEALAMGKHLYTTNREIENTPHISRSSYTVLDVKSPTLPVMKKGGQDDDFYEYYSLRNFLLDILK